MNKNNLIITLFILFTLPGEAQLASVESPGYELIIFEGSDWCPNCRRLHSEILEDIELLKFLEKEGIELTIIDFPQRKKLTETEEHKNRDYAVKYQFEGTFPTIIISEINTDSFKKISYTNQTTDKFIQQLSAKLKAL